MRNKSLPLILLFIIGTISSAQTPPMPPIPVLKMDNPSPITNVISRTVNPTFTVTCPHCKIQLGKYHATNIKTNGWRRTPDGMRIYDRTISFKCPTANCQKQFDAANQKVVPEVPETIAVEDSEVPTAQTPGVPTSGAGGASVLPDTNAPSVTLTNLRAALITDFTNQVLVSYSIDTRGFYWLDAQTGQQVTKAFEFRFQAHSNQFYTAWICSPLSSSASHWVEYPTDKQLHPARGDFLAGISIPIYDTNRFYAIRSFTGTNRVTWQQL